ncbi:tryptophan halogenase family protein [Roseateles koreensis]|uniref:Tryptophan 7-halogenase n=1 Tax=Roseateles koreensis TaxID=2987526 RepID=A0ABT5KSD0_9BURK|nr:tryptophan halogenase family protein [Roseateles koreensis]MDC8784687.1 tryptophan 7-halogenase [Roseateles koreensis]
MNAIKNVLIVGGGTAGWLTAGFLAKQLGGPQQQAVHITVVESSDIPTIGVGEGTFPSIRGTLSLLGIDEARFLRECSATFKQGIKFVDWVRPAGSVGTDHYFHPFSLPSQRSQGLELLPYWLLGAAGGDVAFAEAATMQKKIADAHRGPKRLSDGDYLGPMNYAYHFDAGRFATLLCKHAQSLGVQRQIATVQRVELAPDGSIAALHTAEAGRLEADLYIDCSGFRATLIGDALGAPFRDVNDVLFVDRALAMQVPYERPDAPIPSYTISTAHESGWTWDIGLQERRGIGYVYSSRYTDDARAEAVLRQYVGPQGEGVSARPLQLRVGYRETQWIKNCVAVGLSGGFVEPLEASGIGVIETAAFLISFLFPRDGNLAPVAKQFNTLMVARYERIVNFVKLHYCLSQRRDNAFWTDNCNPASIPEALQEQLAMWRHRPPHRLDFISDLEMYPPTSWQYVLHGMEYGCDISASRAAYPRMEEAMREFQTIRQVSQQALADLPPHRALIEQMCARPSQKPAQQAPSRSFAHPSLLTTKLL